MQEQLVGKVTYYFHKIGVAMLDLDEPLAIGDRIHIAGQTTDLEQRVDSMEMDHQPALAAMPGDGVAIPVRGRVWPNDKVYLVLQEEAAPFF